MSVLLVRVECLCGSIAAVPEGGFFPLCGECGRRMVCPLRGQPGDASEVLAYVADLAFEPDAVKRARSAHAEFDRNYRRQYTNEQLRAALEDRGWPVERQLALAPVARWRHRYTAPPWETAAP